MENNSREVTYVSCCYHCTSVAKNMLNNGKRAANNKNYVEKKSVNKKGEVIPCLPQASMLKLISMALLILGIKL